MNATTFKSDLTNKMYEMFHNIKCKSKLVIYLLEFRKCAIQCVGKEETELNPFQSSVAFDIEISHLICTANQMTGLYMKGHARLKWVNIRLTKHRKDSKDPKAIAA